MTPPRAPLPPINFRALADALLAMAPSLLPAWLPGGRFNGHEYVCAGLSGGEGTSCSVNIRTGQWADFATDEKGGDFTSLYGAIYGMDMGRAAVSVARDYGLEDVAGVTKANDHQRPPAPPPPPAAAPKPRETEGWSTIRPVPANAPEPTFKHWHREASDIVRKSEYRLGDELHGYVVRFRTSDGGKDDIPYTWCLSARDGACKWHWKQFDEPRPLYLPGRRLPEGRTVILVEGEKKADVLQQLLDLWAPGVYTVVSWPGGCKAWQKADWSWIAGSTVLAWPDCDSKREPLTAKERNALPDDDARKAAQAAKPYLAADKQPGMKAMLGIGHLLQSQHGCTVQLLAIDGPGVKPDGWDAADAIETDGWDFDRVQQFFATAYALPLAEGEAPAPAESSDAKKIDGPVDTAGGDSPDAAAAMPWWLACFYDPVKGRWNISRKTVILALRNDPELVGVLGFNELSNTMEARMDWPFPHGRKGKITGAIDLLLGNWLSKKYSLPAITRQALMEGMETVAYENPWHPVREWLSSLQWDGTPRVDKWLIHAIGETPATIKPSLAEYLKLVGRYWLIGMCMRVMEPGSKFDYCPVLEGPGGLGKSTMVETLAGSAWYSDTPFEIGKGRGEADPEAVESLRFQVENVRDSSKAMAQALGYSGEALDNFTGRMRVNLKGADDSAEAAKRYEDALLELQRQMINSVTGLNYTKEQFKKFTEDVTASMTEAGISASGIADIITQGMLGKMSQAQVGEALSDMVIGGIYNAIASNYASQIASVFTGQIIQPIFTAIAAGVPISQAISQQAISSVVNTAQQAAATLNAIFADPNFRAAISGVQQAIAGISGAATSVRAPAYKSATASYNAAADAAKRAAEETRRAWQSIADSITEEIRRIKGEVVGDTSMGQSYYLAQFEEATRRARAGDQQAASMLPELSQAVLDIARATSGSLAELQYLQTSTIASLTQTRKVLSQRFGLTIPAFAEGGMHSGGVRLVGEVGAELEVTGPARYYSAAQTQKLLGSDPELRKEMQALAAAMNRLADSNGQIETHTRQTRAILDRVSQGGDAILMVNA